MADHQMEDVMSTNNSVDVVRRDPAPAPLALRSKEAAKVLGISARLLWTYTKCNDVPHMRIGRRILYPLAALHAWLEARTKESRHD
jgi:excisionase family DNA binding protein